MTKKKHKAEHIVIFAVYKKFRILGTEGRYFKAAFPDFETAEKWLEDHCKGSLFKKEDYMIEEMPAIMKAWDWDPLERTFA